MVVSSVSQSVDPFSVRLVAATRRKGAHAKIQGESRSDEVIVQIPSGASYGTKIRVAGRGSEGLGDFSDGDLYLELEPSDMPGFRREGADIHGSCLIAPEVARSGGFVTVGLPRGGVRVKVPARTCVGDRFRLRGQGLPVGTDGRVGDAFLTVKVG